MKRKQLLRFYFGADRLNGALDNLMLAEGCRSGNFPWEGERLAERLCALVGAKYRLNALWRYLDGVIGGFSERERLSLRRYAERRSAAGGEESGRREMRAAAMKFTRRARSLARHGEAIALLGRYAALWDGYSCSSSREGLRLPEK